MLSPSLVKLGARTPEKARSVVHYPLKLHGENVLVGNSAVDYSISLKFCTEFKPLTPKVNAKVQGQEGIRHNVLVSKNDIIQARISCRRSNMVKIISEPSATRYTAFRVIRLNIRNISSADCRLCLNSVQCFITSQATHCKCLGSEIRGQSHGS